MKYDVERIERACRPLVGLPLFASNRAADLQSFQFGAPQRVPSALVGRPARLVGEFALHVQCAWCLFDGRGRVVASDMERESIESWLGVIARSVVSVQCEEKGALAITLDSGVLRVVPDGRADEQWRLFRPGRTEAHFVVTGSGIEEV
jgi:hypothetical protein